MRVIEYVRELILSFSTSRESENLECLWPAGLWPLPKRNQWVKPLESHWGHWHICKELPSCATRLTICSCEQNRLILRELQALRGTRTLTKEMQNECIIKIETNAVKEKKNTFFFFFEIKQQKEIIGLGQKIISLWTGICF